MAHDDEHAAIKLLQTSLTFIRVKAKYFEEGIVFERSVSAGILLGIGKPMHHINGTLLLRGGYSKDHIIWEKRVPREHIQDIIREPFFVALPDENS